MLSTPQLEEQPGHEKPLDLAKYDPHPRSPPVVSTHVPEAPSLPESRLASHLASHLTSQLVSPPKNETDLGSNLGYLNYYNNYVIPSANSYAVPMAYPPQMVPLQSLQVRGRDDPLRLHEIRESQMRDQMRDQRENQLRENQLRDQLRDQSNAQNHPDNRIEPQLRPDQIRDPALRLHLPLGQHLQNQLPLQAPLPPPVGGTYITYQTYSQPQYPTKAPKQDEFSVKKFASKKSPVDSQLKPYECTFPQCKWAFARQSDLRRHAKSHTEPMFHCPYWRNDQSCHRNGGAFNRLDVLKRHLRLVHYVKDKQQFIPEGSKDDPGWCRVCQRMFQNSRKFVGHCLDCAQQTVPRPASTQPEKPPPSNKKYPEYQGIPQSSQNNQLYELSRLNPDEKTYFIQDDDHKRQLDMELDSIQPKRFKKD